MGRKVDIDDVIDIARAIGQAIGGNPVGATANLLGGMELDPRVERSKRGGRRRTRRSKEQSRAKVKRKVSAYQREFGRQLKRLKLKHPRTPVTKLMKRAHAATRRARR